MISTDVIVTAKTCTGCGQTKPLDAFRKDTRNRDKRGAICKACDATSALARQKAAEYAALRFDYSRVDEAHRQTVQDAALDIRMRERRAAEDLIVIGQRLIEVKEALQYGQFGEWIETEFAYSDRLAREFMNIARRFGEDRRARAVLSATVLRMLAAPNVPDAVVEAVLTSAERQGSAPVRDVMQLIKDSKPQPAKQLAAPKPSVPLLQLTDSQAKPAEPDAAWEAAYKAGFDAAYSEYGPEEPDTLDPYRTGLEGNLDFDDERHTIEAEYSIGPEQIPTGKYAERLARAVALRNVLMEMEAEQDGYFLDEVKRVRDPLKLLIYKLERKLR